MLYWFTQKYVVLCAHSDPNTRTRSRCQHGLTAPGTCAILAASQRVRRESAALPRRQEASTMGWSCIPSPDITSAVQFKTQAVNNYPKTAFWTWPYASFSPRSLETALFLPGTACEGVTALYLYNNVNAFPRYQTLGLYSKINFQQFLENGWSPPRNKRQCWHCALSTFSLWLVRIGGANDFRLQSWTKQQGGEEPF